MGNTFRNLLIKHNFLAEFGRVTTLDELRDLLACAKYMHDNKIITNEYYKQIKIKAQDVLDRIVELDLLMTKKINKLKSIIESFEEVGVDE